MLMIYPFIISTLKRILAAPIMLYAFGEGRAVINFEFVAGRNSHNVQLIDRVGFPEMAKDTIEKYIIHLESVDPYPENNVTLEEEDYRFTLKITAL
jgi:hypothetical protein